jgi:hypothetical protein
VQFHLEESPATGRGNFLLEPPLLVLRITFLLILNFLKTYLLLFPVMIYTTLRNNSYWVKLSRQTLQLEIQTQHPLQYVVKVRPMLAYSAEEPE